MICRLCMNCLNEGDAVELFDTSAQISETLYAQIIRKHFLIKISCDDPISTNICQDCGAHLEDFHNFCSYIQQQQNILDNEFLALSNADDEKQRLDSMNATTADNNIEDVKLEFEEHLVDTEVVQKQEFIADDNKFETEFLNCVSTSQTVDEGENAEDNLPEFEEHQTIAASEQNEKVAPKKNFFNCDLCGFYTDNIYIFKKHFCENHVGHKIYLKCCDNIFFSLIAMRQHVERHCKGNLYKCLFCKKLFSSQQMRNWHSTRCKNETQKDQNKTKSGIKLCRYCGRRFNTADSLNSHIIKEHLKSRI